MDIVLEDKTKYKGSGTVIPSSKELESMSTQDVKDLMWHNYMVRLTKPPLYPENYE